MLSAVVIENLRNCAEKLFVMEIAYCISYKQLHPLGASAMENTVTDYLHRNPKVVVSPYAHNRSDCNARQENAVSDASIVVDVIRTKNNFRGAFSTGRKLMVHSAVATRDRADSPRRVAR